MRQHVTNFKLKCAFIKHSWKLKLGYSQLPLLHVIRNMKSSLKKAGYFLLEHKEVEQTHVSILNKN